MGCLQQANTDLHSILLTTLLLSKLLQAAGPFELAFPCPEDGEEVALFVL